MTTPWLLRCIAITVILVAACSRPWPLPSFDLERSFTDLHFVRTSHYLTMQDGTNLAVDLYLPKEPPNPQSLPTIIHQTRYWRAFAYRWPWSWFQEPAPRGLMAAYAQKFLENGYAWISVDVRGSGASFGSRPFAFSPEEIHDGAEIVDWIIRQPWSNGNVGSLGISYSGTAAEMLLVNQHPAVKAVAPMFAGFDFYSEIAFPGGIHLSWFTKTWSAINHALDHNALPPSKRMASLFIQGVHPVDDDPDGIRLQQAIENHANNWSPYQEATKITYRDDRPPSRAISSIDQLSPQTFIKSIKQSGATTYSYSGWLDGGYTVGAIKRFWALNTPGHRLILGPWDHGGRRNVSPISQGPAQFDHQAELIDFFDQHLKPPVTGADERAPVRYYTMGEERWKTAETWPPPATMVPYFLNSGQSLSTHQAHSGQNRYQVDPSTGTGRHTRWNSLVGVPLISPYPNREAFTGSLPHYTSPPLAQDTEVTGHPVLTLYIQSTTPDATIFAYIDDVNESGEVTYVTEGMLRALHRKLGDPPAFYPQNVPFHPFTKQAGQPMQPGHATKLVFDFFPTSYQFKQGHRIRLTFAGADNDHFAPLPGPPPTLTFLFSEDYPSRIDLPIVR